LVLKVSRDRQCEDGYRVPGAGYTLPERSRVVNGAGTWQAGFCLDWGAYTSSGSYGEVGRVRLGSLGFKMRGSRGRVRGLGGSRGLGCRGLFGLRGYWWGWGTPLVGYGV
jgi:hypothetical protein